MTPLKSTTGFLNRLSYAQKFAILSLIFFLPLVAFFQLTRQQIQNIQSYGTYEKNGTLYLRPLQSLLSAVQEHGHRLDQLSNGVGSATAVAEIEATVDDVFQELDKVDREYGAALGTSANLASLRADWNALRATALTLTAAESESQHARLTQKILDLITLVGDSSNLILDPDLDTYYMMDAVLLQAPEIQNLVSQIRALSQAVARRQTLTHEELKQLVRLTDRLQNRLNAVNYDILTKSLPENASGQMRQWVERPQQDLATATNALLELVNRQLIDAETISLAPEAFNTAADKVINANAAFYSGASQALEQGVEARRARQTTQLIIALVIAVGSVLFGVVIGLITMRAISRPLSALTEAARRMGTGDLSARVPLTSEDEVGQVAMAFNSFADALGDIVRGLLDSSMKLSSSATQIAAASTQMSAGAESQTQQVIRTSSAMEEMSTTIKEVARNAQATATATELAVQRARQGSGKVQASLAALGKTNASLQQLRLRSTEIDQVVKLIADIAAQTNILSLNAAIEAAGAGAAGARFDVVAEEIRKLAGRTAESTTRISTTVAEILQEMQVTAESMNETASQAQAVEDSLNDIVDGISSVNDMVTLISTSTAQQAKAADQVAEALQLITQVSQQTAQATRETATTIDDLSNLAHFLNASAGKFKV